MIAFISKVSESTCQTLKAYDFINDLLYALDKPITRSCVLSLFFPDHSFLEKPAANGQDHMTRNSGLRSTASMEWKLSTIM